jgi:hypothetical protein
VVVPSATVYFHGPLAASPFVLGPGTVRERLAADGALVSLGTILTQAVPSHQDEEVTSVLLGQESVQAGVGARVEGVEEDEEDLRLGHGDQGVTYITASINIF